jgi:hypothetical protein
MRSDWKLGLPLLGGALAVGCTALIGATDVPTVAEGGTDGNGSSSGTSTGGTGMTSGGSSGTTTGTSGTSGGSGTTGGSSGTTGTASGTTGGVSDASDDGSPDGSSAGSDATDDAGPVNLVVGGDFSQNGYAWRLLTTSGTYSVVGNKGCISLSPGMSGGLTWPSMSPPGPPPAHLVQGQSYTFGYTAQVTGGGALTVNAQVGLDVTPYTLDYNSPDAVPSMTPTTFSHPFTVTTAGGDSAAGIAFNISATANVTVCFSNVTLTAN